MDVLGESEAVLKRGPRGSQVGSNLFSSQGGEAGVEVDEEASHGGGRVWVWDVGCEYGWSAFGWSSGLQRDGEVGFV